MKELRLLGGVCAIVLGFMSLPSHADPVSGQGTWESTLQPRDFDGELTTAEAYYDTTLNITWLTDANTSGTTMNWVDANTWATTLNINGIGGWRLPSTLPINGVDYIYGLNSNSDGSQDNGFNVGASGTIYAGSTGSEMAHLFYTTLGNQSAYELNGDVSSCKFAAPDYCLSNSGPFVNINNWYWSETDYLPLVDNAWIFGFRGGGQFAGENYNDVSHRPWAVHDGDVGTPIIPLPVYACAGNVFEPPFSQSITLNNKTKKAIPVKMSLTDADGYLITESDISSPPVVNVLYTSSAGADYSNDSELVPPGLADDGNVFRFDYPYWVINLATKQFTSAGTYEVTAVAGDDRYAIDASSCAGSFIRLP